MKKRYQIAMKGVNGVTIVEYFNGILCYANAKQSGLDHETLKELISAIDVELANFFNIKEILPNISIIDITNQNY